MIGTCHSSSGMSVSKTNDRLMLPCVQRAMLHQLWRSAYHILRHDGITV